MLLLLHCFSPYLIDRTPVCELVSIGKLSSFEYSLPSKYVSSLSKLSSPFITHTVLSHTFLSLHSVSVLSRMSLSLPHLSLTDLSVSVLCCGGEIKRELPRAKTRLEELKKQLMLRKYPLKLIVDGISKALNLDRQLLLNNSREKDNTIEIIPFVTTHNPNNTNITPITTQLINTLKRNTDTRNIFKNYQFINSKRQSQNLKNLLCKSYFSINKPTHRVSKCYDKRCGTCKYIIEGDQINLNNITLKFNKSMNCASKNLIYALVCQGCSEFYIGETGNTLRERTRVHKQQITDSKYRVLGVSKHVHECGKNNFKIIPIHSLNTNSTTLQRRSKETFYRDTLKPKLNAIH